ncbi:MAG: glutamyl-tRNA amidotransferase [Hyphomicrobiales bacterium]|nr:GatB/YqeY domain-containing protein [Hyphomicrobiales bacterium]PCH51587.1 MAG: glutamyl-tRNA amidotransferase [Hyphomicrobiales bacterium]
MRNAISKALISAQKELNKRRVATLRLMNAAINDRDIALRGKGKEKADDEEVLDILAKMVKQRDESVKMYKQAGRAELEAQELEEIVIIQEFLPKQLSQEETNKIVGELITETGAESLRDMGKIMGILKTRYRGQIDMGKAGALIKSQLTG